MGSRLIRKRKGSGGSKILRTLLGVALLAGSWHAGPAYAQPLQVLLTGSVRLGVSRGPGTPTCVLPPIAQFNFPGATSGQNSFSCSEPLGDRSGSPG